MASQTHSGMNEGLNGLDSSYLESLNPQVPTLKLTSGSGNHSSVLAWRILGMTEPGGLPAVRLHRVGQD